MKDEFGEPAFAVEYADKTTGSFASLNALLSQGLSSLVISELTVSAGDYLGDHITIVMGEASSIDLRVQDGIKLSETSDALLRRLRGVKNSTSFLRTTAAKISGTACASIAAYAAPGWLAVVKPDHQRIPAGFELMAVALGIAFWNAHSRALPWTEFTFSGANSWAARQRRQYGASLIIGIIGSLLATGVANFFDW